MSEEQTAQSRNESFANTRWSLVVQAGHKSSAGSEQALASLCSTYWFPLYSYARRRVRDRAEAEDLTQAFFTELLEKNYVASATPDRGRFRAFLLTAFKNFLSKQRDREGAQKRGGGRLHFSLDFPAADSRYGAEPSERLDADQLYERQWAVALLDQTLTRLREESERDGKGATFHELKGFLVGDAEGLTYQDVAERLETTTAAAKMAASRLRKRYRHLLRKEIAETIREGESIDDEIHNLFTALEL